MKEIAALIWIFLIQCDVIRNLRIVSVFERSPKYWKTTALRIILGAIVNLSFPFSMRDHFHFAMYQLFVYPFPFDLMFNLARIKKAPLMYMGSKSLPERLLAGKHIVYLSIKVWLVMAGLIVLYYDEIAYGF